jgi:hypothetical protein
MGSSSKTKTIIDPAVTLLDIYTKELSLNMIDTHTPMCIVALFPTGKSVESTLVDHELMNR